MSIKEKIVPVIKPMEYLEEVRLKLNDSGKIKLVMDKYNDQLVITYAEDSKNSIKYFTEDDFKLLGITKDTLKAIALRNLANILPNIQIRGDNGLYMVTVGGDYEASLILLSSIWTQENFPVDGDFIIAIPNRDLLLVTGSNNKQGIKKLKEISIDSYTNGSYSISEQLFRWTGKKFLEFK